MENMRKYLAELIGTFALVLFGCGSAVIAGDKIGFLGISTAFGLSVLMMVYAIGNISGCHINPAVTVAMLITRKIKVKDAIWYIVVQCVGAIAAAGIVTAIASGKADYNIAINGIGQNFYGKDYSLGACFLAEAVLTGIFLFVIFAATSKKAPQGFAGIPIGVTILLIHLISIPITGTSVNPARSLGPAVFAGVEALSQIWLFWVAPILGAVIASIIWFVLFEQNEK